MSTGHIHPLGSSWNARRRPLRMRDTSRSCQDLPDCPERKGSPPHCLVKTARLYISHCVTQSYANETLTPAPRESQSTSLSEQDSSLSTCRNWIRLIQIQPAPAYSFGPERKDLYLRLARASLAFCTIWKQLLCVFDSRSSPHLFVHDDL